MEIGKANSQRQSLQVPQEKKDRPAATGKEAQAAGPQGSRVEAGLVIKAKLVEVLLVVKKEAQVTFATQGGVSQRAGQEEQGLDLATLTYNGKPLSELAPEEAQALIAEDGHFGVEKTAQRIADFVLAGGGDNLGRLQAAREGVLQGFAEAEKAWGGKLPDISVQTLNRTLELIDARIRELGGGSLLDVTA